MSAVGAFTVTKENIEDDRALLKTGVIGTGTEVEKQPILDRYIPAHPVDRYTFKVAPSFHLLLCISYIYKSRVYVFMAENTQSQL